HERRRAGRAVRPAAGPRRPRGGRDRLRGGARPPPLRLRPRRDVPASAHIRRRPHDGGRDPPDMGHVAQSTSALYLTYGQVRVLGATAPVYNLIVIAASLVIALLIGGLLTRTTFGRIIRAAADNREMVEALGVDLRRV